MKGCFNIFQPVDKAFSLSHSFISLSFAHSMQIISEEKFWGIPALMAGLKEDLCSKKNQSFLSPRSD